MFTYHICLFKNAQASLFIDNIHAKILQKKTLPDHSPLIALGPRSHILVTNTHERVAYF